MAAKRQKSRNGAGTSRTSERARAALRVCVQPRWIPAWIAAVGGGFLVVIFTAGLGVGISPDSASYLSAAQSVSTGQGFLNFDGSPYSSWPPLVPLLLSIPQILGLAPDGAAQFVQIFLHALCLGLLVAWAIRSGVSRPLALALSCAVVLAYPPCAPLPCCGRNCSSPRCAC